MSPRSMMAKMLRFARRVGWLKVVAILSLLAVADVLTWLDLYVLSTDALMAVVGMVRLWLFVFFVALVLGRRRRRRPHTAR